MIRFWRECDRFTLTFWFLAESSGLHRQSIWCVSNALFHFDCWFSDSLYVSRPRRKNSSVLDFNGAACKFCWIIFVCFATISNSWSNGWKKKIYMKRINKIKQTISTRSAHTQQVLSMKTTKIYWTRIESDADFADAWRQWFLCAPLDGIVQHQCVKH